MSKLKMFSEGASIFYASKNNLMTKKSIFYNPMMRINRDFTVLLLKTLTLKNPSRKYRILDLMAASGVRALRIAKEVGLDSVKELIVNDVSKSCYKNIIKNFKSNGIKISDKRVLFENESALKLLLREGMFDFIQVDPFEDINKYLHFAISKIRNNGILALTSTDTASLSGVYSKTCLRRYDSLPQKFDFKHEFGLRILIRNIQIIGAKQDKELTPIFCYYYKHHFGIFMRVNYGRERANKVFREHKYLLYCKKCLHRKTTPTIFNRENCEFCNSKLYSAGKFYTGLLWDKKFVERMSKLIVDDKKDMENTNADEIMISKNISKESKKFLELIRKESRVDVPFTFNTHLISKIYKVRLRSINGLIVDLNNRGFFTERTHFNPLSIRTNADIKNILLSNRNAFK